MIATQKQAPLPEYNSPPVSEVVLSVEFLPLSKWRSSHAGRYWSQISDEYPDTEEKPPLPSQIEKFGTELRQIQNLPRIEMVDANSTRVWFIGNPASRLIQVQKDRFIINWRKTSITEVYPRYESEIRPRFEREWPEFRKFVHNAELGEIEVQQCEVTYVNNVPKGEGWETFDQALLLFSYWSGHGTDGFLPTPEVLSMAGSFLMPNEQGRVYFSVQRVIRQEDSREGVQLQLTARGRPRSSADADVVAWMDLGREWVVRGFTDLTTPQAHNLWGRRK